MHNLLPQNQMAEWKHSSVHDEQDDKIDEYFECLIDCEDDNSDCQQVCTEILH